MMTRREFVRHLALLSAGAAALPEQIAAYERIYDVNLPKVEIGLAVIQDVIVSFTGDPYDVAYDIEFLERERWLLGFTMNRRATFRWVNAPDAPRPVIAADVHWRVKTLGWTPKEDQLDPAEDLSGTITFTDQNGVIHNQPLKGATGRLDL